MDLPIDSKSALLLDKVSVLFNLVLGVRQISVDGINGIGVPILLAPSQYQIRKRSFFGRIVSFFASLATVRYSSVTVSLPLFLCLA